MKKKYYWIVGVLIVIILIIFSLAYTWFSMGDNRLTSTLRGPFFDIKLNSITGEVNTGEYYKYNVTIEGEGISKSLNILINYTLYDQDYHVIDKNNESIMLNNHLKFDREMFIPSDAEPGIYHISLMAVSENEVSGDGDSFYVFNPGSKEIAKHFYQVLAVSPFSLSSKNTGQLNLTLENELNDTINITEIECKIQGDQNSYLYMLTGKDSIAPSDRKTISISNPYSATPTNRACLGINNDCYYINCSGNNCYNTTGKSVGDYYYVDLTIKYIYKMEQFVSMGILIGVYS